MLSWTINGSGRAGKKAKREKNYHSLDDRRLRPGFVSVIALGFNQCNRMPLARSVKDKSSTIKVLSWNINGSGRAGMADVRKNILKSAISRINPDVMLMQETIKSVDGFFEDTGIPQKDYNYMEAANEQEARVIYKKSAFEKVDPSPVNLDTVLKEVIPKNETRVLRSGAVPNRRTIKDRICVVHLPHISTKRKIIFISYQDNHSKITRV